MIKKKKKQKLFIVILKNIWKKILNKKEENFFLCLELNESE